MKYGKKINKVLSQHNLIKDDLKQMKLSITNEERRTKRKKKHRNCNSAQLDIIERALNDLENEWNQIITEDKCGETINHQ